MSRTCSPRITLVLLTALLAAGCGTTDESPPAESESRHVGAFRAVENQTAAGLVIPENPDQVADDDHVRVTCDREQLAEVVTRVEDGTLIVSGEVGPDCQILLRPTSAESIVVTGNGNLVAYHGLESLQRLEVYGNGNATLAAVDGPSLRVVTRGSGVVTIGSATHDELDLDLGGNATVTLAGANATTVLDMQGNAALYARELHVERLDARMIGNAYAEISVSANLLADVQGSADLVVYGDPKIEGKLGLNVEIRNPTSGSEQSEGGSRQP